MTAQEIVPIGKPPWEIASIVVTAFASIAVAATAIWGIVLEQARRRQTRSAADADVSARAFLLRRVLVSWIGPGPARSAPNQLGLFG